MTGKHIIHRVTVFDAGAGSSAAQAIYDGMVEALASKRVVKIVHNGTEVEIDPDMMLERTLSSIVKVRDKPADPEPQKA